MLSGFNTNIRHRGVLFHVQSEDSGREHPHIITHLYHGGTILFSEKSSYADYVNEAGLEARVRELMEGQHKAVLKRLRAGDFDQAIAERLGPFDDSADTRAEPKTAPPVPVSADDSAPLAAAPPPIQRVAPEPASERPLDEVILNYLVDHARKRRRSAGS
jgi:hypothetical protein